MSKAVLISIQPQWCQKIVSGDKTIEVRKTRPKLETPFKCYIYCTYGAGLIERFDACYPNELLGIRVSKDKTWGNCCNGTVIGEFICDRIFRGSENYRVFISNICAPACLLESEVVDYQGDASEIYGWHISKLCLYYSLKELSEFTGLRKTKFGYMPYEIKRAPQSWCYVED